MTGAKKFSATRKNICVLRVRTPQNKKPIYLRTEIHEYDSFSSLYPEAVLLLYA